MPVRVSPQVPVLLLVQRQRPARVSSLALGQVLALVLAAEVEHPLSLSAAAVVALAARRAQASARASRQVSSSRRVGAVVAAACRASAVLGSHRLRVQACRPRRSRRSTTRCTQAHQ